jgi:hypothetical protein
MEIFVKCIRSYTERDDEGHPVTKIEAGKIYRAASQTPLGLHYWGESERWMAAGFDEMAKVEVFCELKGKMELVEELP